ncbi:hypothetical protein E4U57_001799 [Claviceps arundinis]|uniref:Uncharacterized protein n=1 Tax=Claviceps arundinis TaxID=1623583 RepID=A0ABQ7PKS1_9HYPO|nr:hypothetical protein E4U57_001799 [Claviceps arundinis]
MVGKYTLDTSVMHLTCNLFKILLRELADVDSERTRRRVPLRDLCPPSREEKGQGESDDNPEQIAEI